MEGSGRVIKVSCCGHKKGDLLETLGDEGGRANRARRIPSQALLGRHYASIKRGECPVLPTLMVENSLKAGGARVYGEERECVDYHRSSRDKGRLS